MRQQNIFMTVLGLALIALFLFISHLGESFSAKRILLEFILIAPLVIYFTATRAGRRI